MLTLPEDATGSVSRVVVSGLHNKASYTLSADAYNAYADADKGDITATNGETGFAIDAKTHKFTAYVAVFPENVSANQVAIAAYVGENEYYYTIAGTRELAAGKVVPVNVSLTKVKIYTAADYKKWSTENCVSAATYEQMKMYLGAGVYWDAGTDNTDGNQQTYKLPDGKTYHAGLWLKKKEYISGFSEDTATKSVSEYPTKKRPADINKYFFLPAAGSYSSNDFSDAGSRGRYWSSSSGVSGGAYFLYFSNSGPTLYGGSISGYGYLPMVAE